MRPSLTLLTLYCTCPWIKSNPILISQNTVVVVVEEFLAPCILKKHINTRKYSVTNKGPAIRMILFSFNSSLWRKFWLHSVTAVEKKNYTVCVARKLVPYKPYYAIRSAPWLDFSQKNVKRGRITAQKKCVCHCATNAGRGTSFPLVVSETAGITCGNSTLQNNQNLTCGGG